MKHFNISLFLFLLFSWQALNAQKQILFEQDKQTYGSLVKMNEEYYVEYLGELFLIDPSIVNVKLKDGLEKSAMKLEIVETSTFGFMDIAVPKNVNFEEYVSLLKNSNDFKYVDYISHGKFCYSPNDSLVSSQWHLPMCNVLKAWNITTGSPNVRVAVLDEPMKYYHQDLGYGNDGYKNVDETLGWNFYNNSNIVFNNYDCNNHGTAVGGVIGAKTNNTIGVAGVSGGNGLSSGVTLIPLVIGYDADPSGLATNRIIAAILYAVDSCNANIINMSFGSAQTHLYDTALIYATQKNVFLVASSGNCENGCEVLYPARDLNVMAVGAIYMNGNDTLRRPNSSYASNCEYSGNCCDDVLNVVAPGENVISTSVTVAGHLQDPPADYNVFSGTSFAAPIVSGIAALMLSVNPNLTKKQIQDIIETTAKKISHGKGEVYYEYCTNLPMSHPNGSWSYRMGYGLVDAYAAVLAAQCLDNETIVSGRITQNTTWNTPRYATNTVIIPNGVTLNINTTVKCAANVSFIIEPGGKLNLFGGTLTNACGGQLWNGITVLGDPTQPLNKNYQGYVSLESSTIENAIIGITAQSGGMIDANKSYFTNNLTGVKFEPINPLQTGGISGIFQGTKFIMNDQNLYFDAHIKALSSGKIVVYGCDFSSNVPQVYATDNYGIFVSNTSLEIGLFCLTPNCPYGIPMGNKFSGFNTAIYAINTGTSPAFRVRYSKFENNGDGIFIDGINSCQIIRNEFFIDNNMTGHLLFNTGVSVGNATGYKIEENSFEDITLQNFNGGAGLKISNSGTPENEVYKNIFTNFNYAQIFEHRNSNASDSPLLPPPTGLQTLCNEFENSYEDIFVGLMFMPFPPPIPPIHNSIRSLQGNLQKPAGNLFDNTAQININNTNNNNIINYLHGSLPEEIPSNNTNTTLHAANYSRSCPTRNGPDKIKDRNLAQYDEWNEEYEHYLAKLKNTEEGSEEYYEILDQVSYFSALKDNYFNWIIASTMDIRYPISDIGQSEIEKSEIGQSEIETLRFLFSYRNHYTDNLSIAETYMAEHNYEEAQATIAGIYAQFEITSEQVDELMGLQTYIRWLQQLENNQKNIYLLSENEIEYLVNFVETNIGRGRVFANNILCGLYEICLDEVGGERYEVSGKDN